MVDPDNAEYTVGPYQPGQGVPKAFKNAAHPQYDSRSFNNPELEMAKALDKFDEHVWARNKVRVGYGIPLPIKCGSSSTFYPDFLWWVRGTVWAIDPTGRFILEDKLRSKLLTAPAPLKIALVTPDKYDRNYQKQEDGGWTLLRFRVGNVQPETFDNADEMLARLVEESDDLPKPAKKRTSPK